MKIRDLARCSGFGILGVLLTLALGGGVLAQTGPEDSCNLFAVQDTEQADSRLFKVTILDPETGDLVLEILDLGDCMDCDWEAIALDPTDGTLYTLAGGDGSEDGNMWQVDKATGDLTFIGSTGTGGDDEIVSASFRRSDGVLWAFQQNVGLLTIDTSNALATIEFLVAGMVDQFGGALGDNWEGLGWNLEGTTLYGSDGTDLYAWDPVTEMARLVCDNLGDSGDEIEALEFMFNGELIGGVNEGTASTKTILIEFPADSAAWGADACTITPLGDSLIPTDDRDIESFVFEPCPFCGDGDLDPGEECDEGINNCDEPGCTCRTDCTLPFCGDGILDPGEECDDGNNVDGDGCDANCMVEVPGGEGCTPGYWKQRHHFGNWTNYAPTDSYDSVFGVSASFGDITLWRAVSLGGGGENALARHAVAALLNSQNGDVAFAFTGAEVIAMVQSAYASGDFEGTKNILAAENERGCPLGRAERVVGDTNQLKPNRATKGGRD